MTLLDPKNIEVADLVSLIRDISDRLDGIEEALEHIEFIEDAVAGITSMVHKIIHEEPGHERAVALAVDAVITDLADRGSLIQVDEQDEHYEQFCAGCLLKKNGYPRLADLFNGPAPMHDDDGHIDGTE